MYQDDDGEFFCDRQMGWCEHCSRLVAMEKFDSLDSDFESISLLQEIHPGAVIEQ